MMPKVYVAEKVYEAVAEVVDEVLEEAGRSLRLKGNYRSSHEAIAVIREEYLELEREVFHGMSRCARAEAIQLASAALILAAWLPAE